MTVPPIHPLNAVPSTITFERAELAATPSEIADNRRTNTWEGAVIGGLLVAGFGLLRLRESSSSLTHPLVGGAIGAAVGGMIGHSVKTGAEKRSEALLAITNQPGSFGGHLKKEMARREHESYWNGFITGSLLIW